MLRPVAASGQVIVNPKTGETVTFLTTTAETGGRLLRIEMVAEPGRGGVLEHMHPRMTERHELQEGRLDFVVDGVERVLDAPESLEIPPMTRHSLRYGGDRRIRTVIEFEPPGNYEAFMETIAGLARDGKTNAKGVPNLLQTAVLGPEYLSVFALAKPPLWVQRIVFGALAPIGRLAGYKKNYPG
jgi:mannose-6-phosphate isomerase-like protein (cupin superfamily)